MGILDWVKEQLTFSDIIDLYFIDSDLPEIDVTAEERSIWVGYDRQAQSAQEGNGKYFGDRSRSAPSGKGTAK